MKIKQTILAVALMIGFGGVLISPVVSAGSCGWVNTSIINCDVTPGASGAQGTGVWGLLKLAINILTAGIAISAVGGVIYGAILYTSSEGSAEQTKKARMIIANVMIGLVAYAVMYGFLNYLVPGGMFT